MKIETIVSSLVLVTAFGTTTVSAEDTPLPQEKGLIGSMVDAVKETASDVKKAVVKKDKMAEELTETPTAEPAPAPESTTPEIDTVPVAPVAPIAPAAPVAEEVAPATATETTPATETAPAAEKVVEEKDDTKDADAGRTVSDTSIAITAQNAYVQSIMKKVQYVKVAELKQKLAEVENMSILDIRSKSEFAKNKSVNDAAINIPRANLEMEVLDKLTDKQEFIIIISSKGIGGALAANTMQEMGYNNVYSLLGGLENWNKK